MLDAYAAGVNAFVGSTQALPVEYRLVGGRPEAWQPWDCLAVFKVRHLLMGTFESKLWRARAGPGAGPGEGSAAASRLRAGPPSHRAAGRRLRRPGGRRPTGAAEVSSAISWMDVLDSGSNNWALAGNRTSSGKPLLAGDPHRPLDTPNVYYQNHIACGGFDVAGFSFPGCPGFLTLAQRSRGLVCHTRRGGLPGPLRGALQSGRPKLLRVPRRVAAGGGAPRDDQGPRRTGSGAGRDGDAATVRSSPATPGRATASRSKYTATAAPNTGFDALLPMLRAGDADELEEAMRPGGTHATTLYSQTGGGTSAT